MVVFINDFNEKDGDTEKKQQPRRWRSAAFGTEYRVRREEGLGLSIEDIYYLAVRRRRISLQWREKRRKSGEEAWKPWRRVSRVTCC